MRGVYNDFTQLDDIVNEGVIALMGAIDEFDIDKNVKFASFISKRVRGLVIDIARKYDWIPKSVRKTAKDMNNASNALFMYPCSQNRTDNSLTQISVITEVNWQLLNSMNKCLSIK